MLQHSVPGSPSISDMKGHTDVEELPANPEQASVDGISTPPQLTESQQARLWRKVDMRILPILTLMYLCSFLDRGK